MEELESLLEKEKLRMEHSLKEKLAARRVRQSVSSPSKSIGNQDVTVMNQVNKFDLEEDVQRNILKKQTVRNIN